MTIALIIAGHSYKVTPAAAGFAYSTDGHALQVNETFVASQGAMTNDSLKLGMMRGHIVEVLDELLVADRDARLTELRQAMGEYASAHSCFGETSRLIYDTIQTEELETGDDALYGIVMTQPTEGATSVTGTTLNKTAPAVFQAQINGTDNGTAVSATGGSAPFAISATGLTALVAGDVASLYAKDSSDNSRLTNNVNQTVKYATPSITGSYIQGATSVTGTTGASTPNGAVVTLFQGGTTVKTAVVAGAAWTASGIGAGVLLGAGSLTAVVGAGLATASASSTAVVVKFAAPVVDSPIIDGATTVTGTSTAADGTAVKVFKAGSTDITVGSPVVAGGVWTATVTAVSNVGPDSITAKVGTGAALSAASSAVLVT